MNVRTIGRQLLLSVSSHLLVIGAGLAVSILVARALGPYALGLLSLVQWVRVTIGILIDVGFGHATVKFVSELRGGGRPAAANGLAALLLLAQVCVVIPVGFALAIGALPAAQMLGQPEIAAYLPLAAVVLSISLVNGMLRSYLTGLRRFGQRSLVDAGAAIMTLAGTVLALASGGGVRALLVSEVVVNIAIGAALVVGVLRSGKILPAAWPGRDVLRRVWPYCLGIFGITTLDAIIWQRSETFFLGRFVDASQVAFYGLAYNIASLLMLTLSATLGGVLFPAFAEGLGANRRAELQQGYAAATKLLALVLLPIALGGAAVAPRLFATLYGPDFRAAGMIFQVLIIGGTAGALGAPGNALLYALGRPNVMLRWLLPIGLLDLGLTYVLVPPLGGVGAALANSISQAIGVSIGVLYLWRAEQLGLPLAQIGRVALASALMAGGAAVIDAVTSGPLGLPLAIVGGVISYMPALALTRALSAADFDALEALCAGERSPTLRGVLGFVRHGRSLFVAG